MHLLAALSMKNRALIALVTVVVAIFGGIALTNLKQELAPSIEFPQLSIVTAYPGASPDVVNTDGSTPIETAIQGITGPRAGCATPQFLFLAVPNSSEGPGVVDVVGVGAGYQRFDTDPYATGTQSIPAPGAITVTNYWRQ